MLAEYYSAFGMAQQVTGKLPASYRQVKSMPKWEYTSYIEGQYLDQVLLASSFLSLP